MPSAELLAAVSLVLNFIVAAVGLTWGIAKVRDTVRDEIEAHRVTIDNKIDSLRSHTGEMGSALRAKITEVELYTRDTFIRRDTFNNFVSNITESFKVAFDKIDRRLERMETKMDNIRNFQDNPPN
jgi:hypothetical protein